MSIQFGTSGLRGLAVEFTDNLVTEYVVSFLKHAAKSSDNKQVMIAGDFRESTPGIKKAAIKAAIDVGYEVLDGGIAPTPALAYACLEIGCPGIMITGSHIPADRNGIKFYLSTGEILKEDERQITAGLSTKTGGTQALEQGSITPFDLSKFFIRRYIEFWPDRPLTGMSVLFYEHSTTAKTVLPAILEGLGAKVRSVLSSKTFVPVDTEALEGNPELEKMAGSGEFFATVSADGDGDRPLLIDEQGGVVRGDQIGMIVSLYLQADAVVTPISSNSGIADMSFDKLVFTKIGSPYVIEGMKGLPSKVVGFEANGGFLLGSALEQNGRILKALPTRDAVIAILGCLLAAKSRGKKLSELVNDLPKKYTHSELIRGIDTQGAKQILSSLQAASEFFGKSVQRLNSMDGLRFYLQGNEVLHFRPSGNAPEFRIYVESDSREKAAKLAEQAKIFIQRKSAELN